MDQLWRASDPDRDTRRQVHVHPFSSNKPMCLTPGSHAALRDDSLTRGGPVTSTGASLAIRRVPPDHPFGPSDPGQLKRIPVAAGDRRDRQVRVADGLVQDTVEMLAEALRHAFRGATRQRCGRSGRYEAG